ncbi:MAG TPA: hypothetical protein VKU94_05265 [Geobacterales bacterium]|nr:hypothetical protein [Geobacterales bacterium]
MSKKKKDPFEDILRDIFGDIDSFPEFGGGYSISVVSSGGKTKVHVKADKNTDVRKLRQELESMYPNAEITIEGGKIEVEGEQTEGVVKRKPLIEVLDEKEIKEEEK